MEEWKANLLHKSQFKTSLKNVNTPDLSLIFLKALKQRK